MQDDKPSFADKLFRLLPRPTRECPKDIGYYEIAAFAELVYRSRLDLTTTLSDLAAVVDCDRWRTLPKVARRLQQHGLADEQLRPLPDENKYFHRKRTQKRRWQDQLQSTTIYRLCPDAELTEVQNSILWTIHSFNSAGQRPHSKSIAKLLRLDCRTVVKHVRQLQERGYLDADLSVVADPRHWRDAAKKLPGDPQTMWDDYAEHWVDSRYDLDFKPRFAVCRAQFRQSLQDACDSMAEAGYTSAQIRDYWERAVPEACRGDCQLLLLEYFVHRLFYKLFPAVERETSHNRQLGKFHGDCSLGLLKKVTAAQIRAMKARLVEGGVEGLELWCPDFTSLGAAMRPKTGRCGRPVAETAVERPASGNSRCAPDGFARMFSQDAPELDADAWLKRILASPRFADDPDQLYLDCRQAIDGGLPARRVHDLERLLEGPNGKA